MSRLRLAVFVCAMFALLGAGTLAHAQQVNPYFFGMTMTGGEVGAEPWPVVNFSGIRLWDSDVPWSQLNPAPGVYDWRLLNIWMNHAKQNGQDIMYCFGRVPAWLSSDPSDKFCANEPGSCDPPWDLNPDGTGTDQGWKDFVTAIATHAAGRIHYWELWNEFPNPKRWHFPTGSHGTATVQQLVRMGTDARQIIKSIDPTAVIISQSGSLRFDHPANDCGRWEQLFQAGGGTYSDIIAFHGYTQPDGNGAPIPETEVGLLNAYNGPTPFPCVGTNPNFNGFYQLLQDFNLTQPVWDTEGSWAASPAGLTDPDEHAGFLVRFYALTAWLNVSRFYWYEWDNSAVGAMWQWITRWDLAVPNSNGNVSVMWGFGDGSFQAPVNHGAGTTPDAAAVGDFNNDQELDFVVANQASDNVTVFLNSEQSPGTFGAGISSATGSAGKSPVAVATGYFNGSSKNLDVVVANSTANTITVMYGDGTGHFSSTASYKVGSNPSSVVVADFNNDGYPDIAVTNAGDGTVSVWLNNGSGGFTADKGSPYAVGHGPSSVAVGDFNKDKFLDLAVTNGSDGTVSVLLNNGSGGGFTPASYSPLTVGNGPSAVTVADFNKDGYPDLAVANQTDGTATVLLNNGSAGGFTAALGSPYTVGNQPISIVAEDFLGDGYQDIATANKGDGTVTTLMYCHKKSRCTTSSFKSAITTSVGSNPVAMTIGAFDVVGNHDPGTLLKAGVAYETAAGGGGGTPYNWLAGNTITGCTGPLPEIQVKLKQGNQGVWTCGITGSNGYQAQLVWYMDETLTIGCNNNVCNSTTYTVPSGYTQYRTVYQPSKVNQIKNGTVNIGYIPILLENHSHSESRRHNNVLKRKVRSR